MGFILVGGAVTVYVEMVGGASLKRTTRARGAGVVISGGCECDAQSIASEVFAAGCGGCSGACTAAGSGVVVAAGVAGSWCSSRAAGMVAATSAEGACVGACAEALVSVWVG
eukprot:2172658-Prymnesium_polylepis.1